jgi:hypothetical protein
MKSNWSIAALLATAMGAFAWWRLAGRLEALLFVVLMILFLPLFAPQFTFSLYLRNLAANARGSSKNFVASQAAVNSDRVIPAPARIVLAFLRASIVTLTVLPPIYLVLKLILFVTAWYTTKAYVASLVSSYVAVRQKTRDHAAQETLSNIRHGVASTRPFFLYLRPFALTNTLHSEDEDVFRRAQRRKHPTTWSSESGKPIGTDIPLVTVGLSDVAADAAGETNTEWESLFTRGLQEFGELVALGRPGETIGSGRIATSDDEWKVVVRDLAPHAKGFLLIPSSTSGTRWEIELLRQREHFRDCLFVLPTLGRGENSPAAWTHTRQALADLIALPDHPGPPSLLVYDGRGRTHLTLLTIASWLAAGDRRFFFTAADFGSAVTRLLPIAARDREDVWDRLVETADNVIHALGAGGEALSRIDAIPMGLRAEAATSPRFGETSAVERVGDIWHSRHDGQPYVRMVYRACFGDKPHMITLDCAESPQSWQAIRFVVMPEDDYSRGIEDQRRALWQTLGIANGDSYPTR